MSQDLRTIYDSTGPWPAVVPAFAIACVISYLWVYAGRTRWPHVLIAVAVSALTIFASLRLPARQDGAVQEVAGVVTEFEPGSWGGNRDETFVVNAIKFSYRPFVYRGGYNGSPWQRNPFKNPLHDGVHVRISFTERFGVNVITRLEIAE